MINNDCAFMAYNFDRTLAGTPAHTAPLNPASRGRQTEDLDIPEAIARLLRLPAIGIYGPSPIQA